MSEMNLREMESHDRANVAGLVCLSTNYWYQAHGKSPIFPGGPGTTELFFDVYSALPGSSGLVAEDARTDQLMGSCFYHVRPTHVAPGIMNVHPNYFGQGVARALLQAVIDISEREGKPLRLVASAMNLDSFSLYTRTGFVPRRAYQDMVLEVPAGGLSDEVPGMSNVRDATLADVERMAALELAVSHVRRDSDYRHFIENSESFWHMSVYEGDSGQIEGFLASCGAAGCNMVGPGVARTEDQAAALLVTELNQHRHRRAAVLRSRTAHESGANCADGARAAGCARGVGQGGCGNRKSLGNGRRFLRGPRVRRWRREDGPALRPEPEEQADGLLLPLQLPVPGLAGVRGPRDRAPALRRTPLWAGSTS